MTENQPQDEDSRVSSPPPGTSATTGTPEPGQQGGAAKVVLKERTFLDRVRDGMFPSSLQRLRNTLPGFQRDLEALEAKASGSSGIDWKTYADDLLREAILAVKTGDSEKGWQCLNAASRFMLYGLAKLPASASTGKNKNMPLLTAQAIFITNYAKDKNKGLPEWRRNTINNLLNDKEGKLKDPINVDELVEAKRILDEFNDNVYRRLAILKSRLLLLTIAGFAFLFVWLFFYQPPVPTIVISSSASKATSTAGTTVTSGEAITPSVSPAATMTSGATGVPSSSPAATSASGEASAPAASPAVTEAPAEASTPAASATATKAPAGASDQQASTRSVADTFWWMVVLAGLLGGLISAFTSTIRSDIRNSNIPAELSTHTVTFARLMLSALSALAITLFLTSGLLSFEQLNYELILAIAVVSGFSERLLLRAVDQVAKTA